ncbi:hypothetical protein GH733_010666 [Mirounga leonina]|nr:hypothetical protein GH733_010666 [Mirounga leonina]
MELDLLLLEEVARLLTGFLEGEWRAERSQEAGTTSQTGLPGHRSGEGGWRQPPEPLTLAAMEPPAHLGRLLANCKLEQSHQLPTSPASVSQHHHSLKPSEPECEVPLFGARKQEATEAGIDLGAEIDLEAAMGKAEMVQYLGPKLGRVSNTCNTFA